MENAALAVAAAGRRERWRKENAALAAAATDHHPDVVSNAPWSPYLVWLLIDCYIAIVNALEAPILNCSPSGEREREEGIDERRAP